MRTYTIGLGLVGAVLIAITMSLATPSAWAGLAVIEGCFDCENGGTCDPGYHKDNAPGGQQYQGPNPAHGGCSDYSCDAEHYPYSLSLGEPATSRPQDVSEVRALVGRVLRAAHDGDVTELADLTREDARVRINGARRAVQVQFGGNVVAHAALPVELVARVLAHH